MIRLALLRHGHTAWNRAHRIQGRTDIPLDDQAVAGLRALRLPPPWDRAQLWSSPLQRAAQTAELVAGRVPRTDPALMEMDWGDWEGQHGTELRADPASGFRDIEDWGWNYAPPGGESPAHLRARLVPWANALTRDSVAVCHIGVMRVLLAHATGWDFDGPAPFAVKRNRLFVINISEKGWSFDGTPVRMEARP
ncbi:probable phosphoglycerate mutase [Pseudosulfitobacter pseudonitzschiae]|uniref:Phosphoglycerate mutase n=1 Tax=Pseudosulfitobacter pseudonitzschiae TaxID=1402135 RepID=A0A073J2H2_9RHOB|nr:histidine phosphatase family protein [Pseudosulfitobacter pseudonitzschiae]KEJ95896.1 phosphoglycerate mutase [Pseudosulfitobacter pseudonitzschiae]QKS09940.1 histidine phosphatase family protein [Pseudosulfitobacter pseudonitzschiae]SHE90025.1 probable phosphoglycerate mutase [Pseudosulfitobacter pseudonitzschiae]